MKPRVVITAKIPPRVTALGLYGVLLIVFCQSLILLMNEDLLQLKINLVLQFILLIVFGYWSYKKSGSLLSAPLLLVLAVYFWHSTFLAGHYLELGKMFEYTGSILSYGGQYVYQASAMVALSMVFAIVGTQIGYVQQWRYVSKQQGTSPQFYQPSLDNLASNYAQGYYRTGPWFAWLFFFAFVTLTMAYWAVEGPASGDVYMSLYTEFSGSFLYRVYQATKFIGVVAILMMLVTVRTKESFAGAVLLSACLIFVATLMGSRSVPFVYACALLICIDCFIRRISLVQMIALSVAASAVSFIIDHTRSYGLGLKIFDLSQTGRSVDYLQIFWNAGGTIETVLRTMEFSVKSGLLYGQSFLDAVIYLLPRAVVDGLGFQTGFVTPSEWLVLSSPDVAPGAGLGYSLVAEAYLNFGIFGIVLFVLVGWFVSTRYYAFVLNRNIFDALHAFNVAIMLSLHMRSDTGTYLRYLVYGFVLIEIFRVLSARKTLLLTRSNRYLKWIS